MAEAPMETEVVEEEVVQPVAQTISPQAWPKVRFSQVDQSERYGKCSLFKLTPKVAMMGYD